MRIDHIAIWVEDLEKMKDFYIKFFNGKCSEKYVNANKKFSSYFLTFDKEARIEIMHQTGIEKAIVKNGPISGLAHLAISVGSKEKVDSLTHQIRNHGFNIIGEPRTTGDGYYESVIADPEGNKVEITE